MFPGYKPGPAAETRDRLFNESDIAIEEICESAKCWDCGKDFDFDPEEDLFRVGSDDDWYWAVKCPHCYTRNAQ